MNWQAINFDWNQVRAFLATVEEGSLSAASRALGQTQPTVGRQVAALEESLGVVLFERVGKSLTLTGTGVELLDHVREMADVASRISLVASGQSQTIEGQVTITASDVSSAYILPLVLRNIRAAAPLLKVNIVAANDIQDLQRREADIAIRHVRPTQPDLIAKLVVESEAHFYATPEYLDRVGRPKDFEELAKLDFISFGEAQEMINFLQPAGIPVTKENFPIGSKSGIVAWELVRQGFGVSVMSDDIAETTGGVERLLPDMEPFVFPVWLATHSELHTARRIRLVFDLLDEFLASRVTQTKNSPSLGV